MRLSRSVRTAGPDHRSSSAGHLAPLVGLLSLLSWLLPAAVAAYALARGDNADQFGQFRYARDVVSAITEQAPVLLNLPLGLRLFPDLPISLVAYLLALGDPTLWGMFFCLINLALLFACLLLLARAFLATLDEAWLFAALAMLLILAVAGQSKYMLTNTLMTSFHNTLLPLAVLFYALPFLVEGSRPWVRRVVLGGAIAGFGLVIQSNKLFLIWCVVPYVGSLVVLCAAHVLPWRGLVTVIIVAVGAFGVATLLDHVMEQIPFVVSREGALLDRMETFDLGRGIDRLARHYMTVGPSLLLVLYGGALMLAASAWWFAGGRNQPGRQATALLSTTLVTTALIVPAAMLVTGRLSWRYLFYVPFLPLLVSAWSLTLLLGRLRHRRVPPLALVALLTLGLTLPSFVANLRAEVRDRPGIRQLVATLEQLRHRGAIGEAGLSSYWVAHNKLVMLSDFFIGAVWPQGVPYPIAANQFRYWEWTGDCLAPRRFTFVVSGSRHPYELFADKLVDNFGTPAEVVQVPGSIFEIWLYPDSIDGRDFYRRLEALTDGSGKPLPPRCAEGNGDGRPS